MNLFDLLAEVERCGGCLAVRAGKLHYRGPKTGLTPALRLAIVQQKEELLRALSRKNVASCWPPQDAASRSDSDRPSPSSIGRNGGRTFAHTGSSCHCARSRFRDGMAA